jgi:parallel beta-helix repeat protein
MNGKLSIIKGIILWGLLMVSFSIKASSYYFSSSTGSDSYTAVQAKNQATPWQSINKLNSIMSTLLPGDVVSFKRGDTFSGTITVGVSGSSGLPITFGVYGTGTSKAIFDNRLTLSGWTNLGGNIWEASNTAMLSQPTALFVDNNLRALGRFPNLDAANGGYLTVSSHPAGSKTVFTDNTLSGSTNWTGAEAVLRTDHYILNRAVVNSQSGQTITLGVNTQCEIKDKYGYFFQNSPATLDKDGEWCYMASTQKIRLYSVTDPNTRVTKVSNTDNYFNINAKSYLVIDGLAMYGAKKCAISLATVTYCTIKNCDFIASGTNALNIGTYGATDNDSITLLNNSFIKTQSNCINAFGKRLSFIGNTFKNTGTVPGMAESGQYSMGIYALANGLDIEQNVFDSTGNSAIDFLWSANVVIKGNSINHFCTVLDDGGGIYCWRSPDVTDPLSRKITNNIVLNGIGAKEGTDCNHGFAEGIYIDDRSANVEISNNTVAFCSNSGILIHNSPKCSVKNNTVYGCKQDFYLCHDDNAPTFPLINCDIQNNLFASSELDASKSQLFWYRTIDETSLATLGALDNNIYCQPFLTSDFIEYKNDPSTTLKSLCINLDEWKTFSGYDAHSMPSSTIFPMTSKLLSTNGIPNGKFETNSSGWDTWNPTNNSSTLSRVNGQLDGSCLAFTVTGSGVNTPSRLSTILPPITAGKTYLLKFSTRSTITGSIALYMIEDMMPYRNGSEEYDVNVCSFRAEKEILITATTTLASPSLFILSGPGNGTLYLDNIEFYEVTPTNPDDYIHFEYNITGVSRNFTADRNWVTPAGISYLKGSSITIPPFGSVVLLKGDISTGVINDIPVEKQVLKLYPNPADDKVYIQTALNNHPVEATLFDISGREIRREIVNTGSAMDISALPKGMYLIRVFDNNTTHALKLIKR